MIMERLKTGTHDMHSLAEGRQFQRRMLKGGISRQEYTGWLGQMLLIHGALEKHLSGRLRGDSLFAAVREEQFQEPNLIADLAALGCDPRAVAPLPATAALIADIDRAAAEEPLALLGYHYVLEGSKNGNRFIARQLVPALGLAPRRADRYLDPFADAQPVKWAEFKAAMTAIDFAGAQIDVLVAAARRMFEGIGELSDQLMASQAQG
jgi:heme oxygenase